VVMERGVTVMGLSGRRWKEWLNLTSRPRRRHGTGVEPAGRRRAGCAALEGGGSTRVDFAWTTLLPLDVNGAPRRLGRESNPPPYGRQSSNPQSQTSRSDLKAIREDFDTESRRASAPLRSVGKNYRLGSHAK